MGRLLGILKYIAIYYGFIRMSNYIICGVIGVSVTLDNVSTINSTSGLIAVLMTLLCYRAERTEFVKNAPTKKLKIRYIILTVVTLGIIVLIYKKRRDLLAKWMWRLL